MKVTIFCIALLDIILCLDYGSVLWQSVIAPKREAVRREVWENTRSFSEGKLQELIRYYHQFNQAETREDKAAIASIVRLSFADTEHIEMKQELKQFINTCFKGAY